VLKQEEIDCKEQLMYLELNTNIKYDNYIDKKNIYISLSYLKIIQMIEWDK
jgi:hypothetical protein